MQGWRFGNWLPLAMEYLSPGQAESPAPVGGDVSGLTVCSGGWTVIPSGMRTRRSAGGRCARPEATEAVRVAVGVVKPQAPGGVPMSSV